jgi:hypothetical protein
MHLLPSREEESLRIMGLVQAQVGDSPEKENQIQSILSFAE